MWVADTSEGLRRTRISVVACSNTGGNVLASWKNERRTDLLPLCPAIYNIVGQSSANHNRGKWTIKPWFRPLFLRLQCHFKPCRAPPSWLKHQSHTWRHPPGHQSITRSPHIYCTCWCNVPSVSFTQERGSGVLHGASWRMSAYCLVSPKGSKGSISYLIVWSWPVGLVGCATFPNKPS